MESIKRFRRYKTIDIKLYGKQENQALTPQLRHKKLSGKTYPNNQADPEIFRKHLSSRLWAIGLASLS